MMVFMIGNGDEAEPEVVTEESFGEVSIRAVDSLRQSGQEAGCPAFAERMVQVLLDGLRSLDELPRDDPFWQKTNHVTTVYKLQKYAQQRLEHTPEDRAARWALVAIDLAFGANDGGLSWLGPMIADDVAVADAAVIIANWVAELIGPDASDALRAACAWADSNRLRALARTDYSPAIHRILALLDD
ncbi:hypothetical protein IU427_31255 [Nocardia beijingensis]|uniref:hypothetical protein n=1 Tax=Nocardia beijingensis TaxID=95162 RepID=UPI0018930C29|nr:hypothetical protein [Nocardia beijingensis]MBF6469613.1 hypothetical protein [Nocardia beijingensis]